MQAKEPGDFHHHWPGVGGQLCTSGPDSEVPPSGWPPQPDPMWAASAPRVQTAGTIAAETHQVGVSGKFLPPLKEELVWIDGQPAGKQGRFQEKQLNKDNPSYTDHELSVLGAGAVSHIILSRFQMMGCLCESKFGGFLKGVRWALHFLPSTCSFKNKALRWEPLFPAGQNIPSFNRQTPEPTHNRLGFCRTQTLYRGPYLPRFRSLLSDPSGRGGASLQLTGSPQRRRVGGGLTDVRSGLICSVLSSITRKPGGNLLSASPGSSKFSSRPPPALQPLLSATIPRPPRIY